MVEYFYKFMVESLNFSLEGLSTSQILNIPTFLREPKWEELRSRINPIVSTRTSVNTDVLDAVLDSWNRGFYPSIGERVNLVELYRSLNKAGAVQNHSQGNQNEIEQKI